jgi:hypothetical protein
MRGIFNHGRIGQVRIAITISKIEDLGAPSHLLACFGWKFERTISEKTTLSLMSNNFLMPY